MSTWAAHDEQMKKPQTLWEMCLVCGRQHSLINKQSSGGRGRKDEERMK